MTNSSLTLEMRELEELEELLLSDFLDLERELLERELLELELLELEEALVPFFRSGSRIFLSFNSTVFPSGASSSSFMVMTLIIFSAALGPTCTSNSSLSMAGSDAAKNGMHYK